MSNSWAFTPVELRKTTLREQLCRLNPAFLQEVLSVEEALIYAQGTSVAGGEGLLTALSRYYLTGPEGAA